VPGAERILVLGAGGNVGSLLRAEMSRRGERVIAAYRSRIPDDRGESEWRHADLSDPESLRPALAGVDAAIWTPSVGLVPRCLDVLRSADLRRVVVISSASVHTRLSTGGARMKRAAEEAIRASGIRFTILRPTMIYGNERDRNVSRLLDFLDRSSLFPMFGSGSALMQPVYLEDVVQAVLGALEAPAAEGRSYDLGGAEPLSYRALVEQAAAALGRRVRFVHIPTGLAARALRAANRIGWKGLREEQVLRLAEDKVVDNGPVSADLGIRPINFAQGVRRQVESRTGGPGGRSSRTAPERGGDG